MKESESKGEVLSVTEQSAVESKGSCYYVYTLHCIDNSYYIGFTKNLEQRILHHTQGNGAKYTSEHKVDELVYFEGFSEKLEALKREKQLKDWSRAKKEALIEGDKILLEELSKRRS